MSGDPYGTTQGHAGHERRDVVFKPLVIAAVALVVLLVVAVVGMERLFAHLAAREAERSGAVSPLAAQRRQAPPEPRLQPAPIDDLRKLRAREQAMLESYGWVDRPGGVVRIPIERAIELTLERAPKTPARRDGKDGKRR